MVVMTAGARGLCAACGTTGPPGTKFCGQCGRPFALSPLAGPPLAEAPPVAVASRFTVPPETASPPSRDTISCPSCGAPQSRAHVHCASCGTRLAPEVIESNKKSYKPASFPLFHPRLVVKDRRRGEPEVRTWGDRVARLYFNVSLVALLGYVTVHNGWLPASITDGVRARVGTNLSALPTLPNFPWQRGLTEVAAGISGEPAVLMRAEGASQPDKDVQILPYRVERSGNQLVALGELQNTSKNDAVNVAVTFTFLSRDGEVVDVAKQAWKVTVPYRPSIARGGIDIQWVTRPPR
jgi:hypothetical protein